jgi:uridylate kinase
LDSDKNGVAVLKFGGSSFASPAAYKMVAQYLAKRVASGQRLCVIVSAMSGTTGRLAELLGAIVADARPEDRDAVLGTGEILAAALVRAAVVAEGVEAVSLNAFQLGWCASDNFTCGKLINFPHTCISAALERAQVVVISGGQATNKDGRLVMLGRNSSDLSAIAVAAALSRQSVTIFSDVEGVFTADPYRLANTRLIPRLSYRQANAYSQCGAKVLYSACIELAEQHQIRIQCASLANDGRAYNGTEISNEGFGIQVCLPDNFVIYRPMADPNSGLKCGDIGNSGGPIPVVNLPGHFAARLDDSQRRLIAAEAVIPSEDLSVIVSFSGDDTMRAYAVRKDEMLPRAQAIHDDLLFSTPFQQVSRRPSKQRGTHSGVFNCPSEATAV